MRCSEAVTFLLHVKFIETPPEFVGLCGHGIDTINQINEWMFFFLLSEHLPGNFMELVTKALTCIKKFWKSVELTLH